MAAGIVTLELPPKEGNPRNSEGSFITFNDGRIMLAYTRFYGGGGDHAAATIVARYSSDGGRTWTDDSPLVENEGQWNVMSVSLLRLASGAVAMLYLVKNENFDCRPRLRFSHDEGRSWSAASHIIDEPGYYVGNNDRLVQLAGGRLIMPTSLHPVEIVADTGKAAYRQGMVVFWLSDDSGQSWRQTRRLHMLVASKSGLQEPGVVELADGRLFAWARTDAGCEYGMYSADAGETWSPPAATPFISPVSPMSLKRIPGTGHLLALWNDHSGRFPLTPERGRQPLVSAISRDEGVTWRQHKQVEDDLSRGYHYTAIHFPDNQNVLLGYCAGPKKPGNQLGTLRVRLVPLTWFYE